MQRIHVISMREMFIVHFPPSVLKFTQGMIYMKYQVPTPHGVFEVIQSLSYGDMIIAGILIVIAVIVGFKVLYDIADREGYI